MATHFQDMGSVRTKRCEGRGQSKRAAAIAEGTQPTLLLQASPLHVGFRRLRRWGPQSKPSTTTGKEIELQAPLGEFSSPSLWLFEGIRTFQDHGGASRELGITYSRGLRTLGVLERKQESLLRLVRNWRLDNAPPPMLPATHYGLQILDMQIPLSALLC